MSQRSKQPVCPDGRKYKWHRDGWVPPDWDAGRESFQRANGLMPDGLPGPKTGW